MSLDSQIKKMRKILSRAQVENSDLKKAKIAEMKAKIEKNPNFKDSEEHKAMKLEIEAIRTIADGTKETYGDTAAAVLREANANYGIQNWKHLKQEDVEKILRNRIDKGQSAQTIRKVVHALDYINEHAVKTRVFKEKHGIEIVNHERNLEFIEDEGIMRHSSDSKRFKATKEEALAVIAEMEKYNKEYADIARYELLTGFRIIDSVGQTKSNIDIDKDRHTAEKAKGGLTNIVHTNHHTDEEKSFLRQLAASAAEDTGRLFEKKRKRDEYGNYRSDRDVARAVTQLASRCAKKLGIGGENGETFSSHSLRGAFANDRMCYYASQADRIDELIREKIREQPRLRSRYNTFEERIRAKIKPANRAAREIQDFEKIQWLISTDLNHSRQDVVRYYVPSKDIKAEITKHQK